MLKRYFYPFPIEEIKEYCRGKSGVYYIKNEITKEGYIGSAVSKTERGNRMYTRFKNHFYNTSKTSNINLRDSIKKYGIRHFSFNILFIESLPVEIIAVREKETYYIKEFNPEFNIPEGPADLKEGTSSLGYKHSPETRLKMREEYSQERRGTIGNLNKNKPLKERTKKRLSELAIERYGNPELKKEFIDKIKNNPRIYLKSKITLIIDPINHKVIKEFPSLKEATRWFKGDYRTFRRYVNSGKILKKYNIIIQYKN